MYVQSGISCSSECFLSPTIDTHFHFIVYMHVAIDRCGRSTVLFAVVLCSPVISSTSGKELSVLLIKPDTMQLFSCFDPVDTIFSFLLMKVIHISSKTTRTSSVCCICVLLFNVICLLIYGRLFLHGERLTIVDFRWKNLSTQNQKIEKKNIVAI